MKLKIVIGSQEARTTSNLDICVRIILDRDRKMAVGYEFVQDIALLMKLTRGSAVPIHGIAILDEKDVLIGTSYIDLVKWIDAQGLFHI